MRFSQPLRLNALILAALFVSLTACVPLQPAEVAVVATALALDTPTASAASPTATATLVPTVPTSTPLPRAASATTGTRSRPLYWLCYYCGGNQIWELTGDEAVQRQIPVELGVYFDYAAATDRLLYGSHFPSAGAGPGNVSVTDLWMLTVDNGIAAPIFIDDEIVEALWAPSGEAFAYIRATADTYELRWRTSTSEDRLLASDVAFTFSIAPGGDRVAFTRESTYGVGGEPGLYVVDIATGTEQQLADIDRAGSGSLEERPIWSPLGDYVILALNSQGENNGLIRAATDGSDTIMLEFAPTLSAQSWYDLVPTNLIWAEPSQLLGTTYVLSDTATMGGEPQVVVYQLNGALDTIVGGTGRARRRGYRHPIALGPSRRSDPTRAAGRAECAGGDCAYDGGHGRHHENRHCHRDPAPHSDANPNANQYNSPHQHAAPHQYGDHSPNGNCHRYTRAN